MRSTMHHTFAARAFLPAALLTVAGAASTALAADPPDPSGPAPALRPASRAVGESPAVTYEVPPALVDAEAPPIPRRLADPRLAGVRVPVVDLGQLHPGRIQVAAMEDLLDPGRPTRVGFVRELPRGGLSVAAGDATIVDLDDGRRTWSFTIRAAEALRTRLRFTDVDLDGAVMTVFDDRPDTTVRGPFRGDGPRGDGDFWSASVTGDVIHVEIVGPADAEPQVTIAELVHFDRDPAALLVADGGQNGGGVFDCHVDATCENTALAARDATGQINYVSGGESFMCSGTLLNDLDSATSVPYFITARHCMSTASEVASMEVVWNWERANCTSILPNYASLPRNVGATLLVTHGENDMTFVRLDGGIMANAAAGFTTETSLDDAIGYHHPGGSEKRAVGLDSVGVCPGCLCLDGDDFDYYNMEWGLVEGGSSGSGVFTSNSKFSGQLFGRCSDFSDPDDMNCSNIDSYWAVYGEFETTWEDTDVAFWLELGGTIHVDPGGNPICGTGSDFCPFDNLTEGVQLAWAGSRILVAAGNYDEAITIDEAIELVPVGGTITIGQ